MGYWQTLVVLVALFGSLAVSLNLLLGSGGIFSVSHALVFGVGAYATAILETRTGASFLVTVLVGMALAGLINLLIAGVSLRVSEDYLIIASFGLQLIGTTVLNGWSLTGGADGIYGVPYPKIFGWTIDSAGAFIGVSIGLLVITVVVVETIERSSWGLALRAARDDEVGARAYGVHTRMLKTATCVASGALAAVVGSLYVGFITLASPVEFNIQISILLLSMVVIGGNGSTVGVILGAALLEYVPQGLQQISLPSNYIGPGQQVIYGLMLVLIPLLRPRGIFPSRRAPIQRREN